jgi:hypothetical protein
MEDGNAGKTAPVVSIDALIVDKKPEVKTGDNQGETVEDIKRQRAASASEAKRLKEELDKAKAQLTEMEPTIQRAKTFEPFNKMLEEDPNLVKTVLKYVEGGSANQGVGNAFNAPVVSGGQPVQLNPVNYGLASTSDFDLEEALANPHSPSGRFWTDYNRTTAAQAAEAIVDRKLGAMDQRLKQDRAADAAKTAEAEFLKNHPDLTAEDLKAALEWSKKAPVTLDRVFALYSLENGKNNIQDKTRQDIFDQMKRANDAPITLANKASTGDGKSESDKFMDLILKSRRINLNG